MEQREHRDAALHGSQTLHALHTHGPGSVRTMRKPRPPLPRLTHPLVRDGETLRRASWDEAMTRAVEGLNGSIQQHGPKSFGIFSCSKATNEVNYAAQKFIRGAIGSNNIDSCNRT